MQDFLGKILLNRYRVDEFLGRGGMAEVYKVWDNQRMVYLAMKVLHQDMAEDKIFLRRFKREAQTLAKLEHPHIVRFHGLEQDGRTAFMLMEFVDGQSLRTEIFETKQALSPKRIREVMLAVSGALYYAHHNGMVHCDIKPANIMVDSHGEIRLADFGIARMTDAATTTMAGAGSPPYMAPEQIRGKSPVPQTDIYALGVVLFEMLTGGERPFTGEQAQIQGSTKIKILWEHLKLKAPSPKKWNPSISPQLEALVLKSLAKNPENRFPDALAFLNALELSLGDDITEFDLLIPPIKKAIKSPQNRKSNTSTGTTSLKSQFTRSNFKIISKIWGIMLLVLLCLAVPVLFFLSKPSSLPFSLPFFPKPTEVAFTPLPVSTNIVERDEAQATYTPAPTYTYQPSPTLKKGEPTYTPYPTYTPHPSATKKRVTYTPSPRPPTRTPKPPTAVPPTRTPKPPTAVPPTITPSFTPTTTQLPPPSWSEAEIFADRGWQDSGIEISSRETLQIVCSSGSWTEQVGVVALHNPEGSSYICGAEHCCEPMPYERKGSLIGKIGDEVFFVGTGVSFSPVANGTLFFRINDCDGSTNLSDNSGFMNVKIKH